MSRNWQVACGWPAGCCSQGRGRQGYLDARGGVGELRDVAEPRTDGEDEEDDARFRQSDVEAAISEAGSGFHWFLDALATAMSRKAVGPGALPAVFLKAGRFWLLPHLARLAARVVASGVPKAWRGGRMALVPKKAMPPFTLQKSWPRWCVLRRRRQVHASMELSRGEAPNSCRTSSGCTSWRRRGCGGRQPCFIDLASAFCSAPPELATSWVHDVLVVSSDRVTFWKRHCHSRPIDRSRCFRSGRVCVKAGTCGSRFWQRTIKQCGSCRRTAIYWVFLN